MITDGATSETILNVASEVLSLAEPPQNKEYFVDHWIPHSLLKISHQPYLKERPLEARTA
jgi:hypothetical protein